MFRRGLAFCLAVGFATVANAGTSITFVRTPDQATYTPGQAVTVDVLLSQDTGSDQAVRYIQLDLSASDAMSATYPLVNHPSVGFWDFSGAGNCPGSCGDNHFAEGIDDAARADIGSVAYLGLTANLAEQIVLPADGSAVAIGTVDLTMPGVDGTYTLNVVNVAGVGPDAGAEVRWGFGMTTGDELTRCRADGTSVNCPGGLTGGTVDFEVGGGGGDVTVRDSFPAANGNLWRTTKHVVRIRFNGDLPPAPSAGDIEIRKLLPVGATDLDVSGNFSFVVENDENGDPRVLKIEDTGNNLDDRSWYQVVNVSWAGVEAFDLDFRQGAGNANDDNFVNALDLSFVNSRVFPLPGVPFCWDDVPCQQKYRANVTADNFVNALDLSAINGRVFPLPLPGKPSGH